MALAASAGGLRALSEVLSLLPAGFPAAVVIVQHMSRTRPNTLTEIFGRRCPLPVHEAHEGTHLCAGEVYVAPPNFHLLVRANGTLCLSSGPLVNFVRPAADSLFESLAESYGIRGIAVILSGTGSDGATGARAVKQRGGLVIAQDHTSSEFPGMPDAVAQTGLADYILPLDQIPARLRTLVCAPPHLT